ncbi:hypothetical protein OH491_07255 [Termitidicoccus mucosus]|uniref:phosphorylase family protein n=1 Tax=Termitidicoccus mucosus TaxID=1184151 RepID=UPI0031837464
MKILIIEDNADKAQMICQVVKSCQCEEPDVCTDYIGAIKSVTDNHYDLVLMDVIIPKRFGDKPNAANGIAFLKETADNSHLKKPLHIIGITADLDTYDGANEIFSRNLWFLLHYDPTYNEWEESIRNKINYIGNQRATSQGGRQAHDFDLAILTALPSVEYSAVRNLPLNWMVENRPSDASDYLIGRYANDNITIRIVAATANQMGMPAISTLSSKVIAHFRPRYLLIVGITAGYRDSCHLGDILISDQTWDCGSGKNIIDRGESRFLPNPHSISLDGQIKDSICNFVNTNQFVDDIYSKWKGPRPPQPTRAMVGPMISGAAVIADHNIAKSYRSVNRKIIGLDMETYAVFYSAHHCLRPSPIPMSIKAVSDYADEEKSDDYQAYAAYASTAYAYELIKAGFFNA